MLLAFRCKNFRSIRDEQEFSLVATKTRSTEHDDLLLSTPIGGLRALRCAAVYGANASGKSNLLHAMARFSAMVSNSQRKWDPTGSIPSWDPFELDDVSRSSDTSFEVDFVNESIVYNYGFRYNNAIFLEEWLIDNTGRAKTLFRRKTEDSAVSIVFPSKNLGSTSEEVKLLDVAKLQTRANSLYLSSAAQGNHDLLSSIFKWIVERFNVLSHQEHPFRSYTAQGCSKPDRKRQIRDLLAAADTGIVDFRVAEEEAPETFKKAYSAVVRALKEISPEPAELPDTNPLLHHEITMLHKGAKGGSYPLDFSDESAGTRAYFRMLGPILDELRDGSLLLIDELESSLHPNLSRQIVRMFNDPTLNPRGAQLVFTAHDTTLLDLEIMRRDQIWFAEKDDEGVTTFKPLTDFKPRKSQDVALAYLHGRFGAIPFLDERLFRSGVGKSPAPDEQLTSSDPER